MKFIIDIDRHFKTWANPAILFVWKMPFLFNCPPCAVTFSWGGGDCAPQCPG